MSDPQGGGTARRLTEISARRILIISNRRSGQGAEALAPALEVFREHGVQCRVETPDDLEALHAIVRRGRSEDDAVVIAGGDGTMHAAIPVLRGEGAPIGILPLGTANDLARSLEIPADLRSAAEVVVSGAVQRVDLGWVNGQGFFNVAHVGVGARARNQLTPERKRRLGVLGYPVALFHALRRLRPFRVCILANGKRRWLLAVHVAVGNGRYFGGGVPVHPDAGLADDRFDIHCIRAARLPALLLAGGSVWLGTNGTRRVWRTQAHRLFLWTPRPHRMTADGEPIGSTPARFHVEPAAIPLIVPRPGADG